MLNPIRLLSIAILWYKKEPLFRSYVFYHHHPHFRNKRLIDSVYFPLPACSFGIARAAARVRISKHLDLLQLAAIPPVEFQDATMPGLQHNSASEF